MGDDMMATFVEFDELIYLQFDHSPGYAQWWVMINLGHAVSPDGKGNAMILQRFRLRQDAESYKERIKQGCLPCSDFWREMARNLYAAIEHGDEQHRQWLRDELNRFFRVPDQSSEGAC